ncbi:MAG: PDZ domain-containing protein [Phycisphaerales bacterium]
MNTLISSALSLRGRVLFLLGAALVCPLGGCIVVVGNRSAAYDSGAYYDTSRWPAKRIGLAVEPIGPALAKQAGVNQGEASVVSRVNDGSPAARAGVQQFDVLSTVDGQPAGSIHAVRAVVRAKDIGACVRLRVIRGGQPIEIDVPIERTPSSGLD